MTLTKADLRAEAVKLPAQERIDLVFELWDSIGEDEIPVPGWHLDLIDERLDAMDKEDPETRSRHWEEVHREVFPDRA